MRFRTLVILCAVPLALPAQAGRDTVRAAVLEELTVTAERRPSNTSTAAVRTISADAMQRRATFDLTALLREIPGVQLDPMVGSGLGVSIQGLGSDRILVLMDGSPMPGRISNEFDLTRVDTRVLQRVEVVEGPQSTLYGSSALGGVINLVTRNPAGRRFELATQGGSFGHLDLSGRVSATVGTTALSVDLGRRAVDVVPGRSEGSVGTSERWTGMARMVRPLGGGILNLRGMHIREDQEYLTGSAATSQLSLNRNLQTDLLAAWSRAGTEVRAHYGAYDHTLRSRTIATGAGTDEPQIQSVADVEALRRMSLGTASVVLGLRGEVERTESPRLDAGARRNRSAAVFGSGEVTLAPALALSGGARVTVAEAWGTNVAPRLGLHWAPAPAVRLKVSAARGFRAPSFLEQFADYVNTGRGNYAIRGNVDLVPERSWNVTAEVEVRGDGGVVYLRGYRNELRDFIETALLGTEGGLPVYSYRNVGEARTQGLEVGGRYAVGVVSLAASYAHLDTEDRVSGRPLLGQSPHTVRGAVTVEPGTWFVETEFVRAAATPLSQDRTTGALVYQGAAPRLNLRGGVTLARAWRLTTGVDNVTNAIPERAVTGFGRRWFAGLTVGGAL